MTGVAGEVHREGKGPPGEEEAGKPTEKWFWKDEIRTYTFKKMQRDFGTKNKMKVGLSTDFSVSPPVKPGATTLRAEACRLLRWGPRLFQWHPKWSIDVYEQFAVFPEGVCSWGVFVGPRICFCSWSFHLPFWGLFGRRFLRDTFGSWISKPLSVTLSGNLIATRSVRAREILCTWVRKEPRLAFCGTVSNHVRSVRLAHSFQRFWKIW